MIGEICLYLRSLPVWECGLKFLPDFVIMSGNHVTPCVGVWIEILSGCAIASVHNVTPCVGVWIEINMIWL